MDLVDDESGLKDSRGEHPATEDVLVVGEIVQLLQLCLLLTRHETGEEEEEKMWKEGWTRAR